MVHIWVITRGERRVSPEELDRLVEGLDEIVTA